MDTDMKIPNLAPSNREYMFFSSKYESSIKFVHMLGH